MLRVHLANYSQVVVTRMCVTDGSLMMEIDSCLIYQLPTWVPAYSLHRNWNIASCSFTQVIYGQWFEWTSKKIHCTERQLIWQVSAFKAFHQSVFHRIWFLKKLTILLDIGQSERRLGVYVSSGSPFFFILRCCWSKLQLWMRRDSIITEFHVEEFVCAFDHCKPTSHFQAFLCK